MTKSDVMEKSGGDASMLFNSCSLFQEIWVTL